MPKDINLTGTSGKTYDLDKLSNTNVRNTTVEPLKVQVWYWNPNLDNSHRNPNPPGVELGNIWLSRLITEKDDPELYKKIALEA